MTKLPITESQLTDPDKVPPNRARPRLLPPTKAQSGPSTIRPKRQNKAEVADRRADQRSRNPRSACQLSTLTTAMTEQQYTCPPARLSTRAVVGKGSFPYSGETGRVEPAPGSPSAIVGSRARPLELSNGAVILGGGGI